MMTTKEQIERARFEMWAKDVADHNPAGLADIWINAARSGWYARAAFAQAESPEPAIYNFGRDGSLNQSVGVKADLEHPGNDTGGETAESPEPAERKAGTPNSLSMQKRVHIQKGGKMSTFKPEPLAEPAAPVSPEPPLMNPGLYLDIDGILRVATGELDRGTADERLQYIAETCRVILDRAGKEDKFAQYAHQIIFERDLLQKEVERLESLLEAQPVSAGAEEWWIVRMSLSQCDKAFPSEQAAREFQKGSSTALDVKPVLVAAQSLPAQTVNQEMLAALKEFITDAYIDDSLCGWCGYRPDKGETSRHNAVCRVARAESAIARAESEPPASEAAEEEKS